MKFFALTKFLVLSIFLREHLKERSSLFTKKFNFSGKMRLELKIRRRAPSDGQNWKSE